MGTANPATFRPNQNLTAQALANLVAGLQVVLTPPEPIIPDPNPPTNGRRLGPDRPGAAGRPGRPRRDDDPDHDADPARDDAHHRNDRPDRREGGEGRRSGRRRHDGAARREARRRARPFRRRRRVRRRREGRRPEGAVPLRHRGRGAAPRPAAQPPGGRGRAGAPAERPGHPRRGGLLRRPDPDLLRRRRPRRGRRPEPRRHVLASRRSRLADPDPGHRRLEDRHAVHLGRHERRRRGAVRRQVPRRLRLLGLRLAGLQAPELPRTSAASRPSSAAGRRS